MDAVGLPRVCSYNGDRKPLESHESKESNLDLEVYAGSDDGERLCLDLGACPHILRLAEAEWLHRVLGSVLARRPWIPRKSATKRGRKAATRVAEVAR